MLKSKTNSGSKKRFALTDAYHSHILTKKSKKRKRNLDHFTLLDQANAKQVKSLLCMR